MDTLTALDAVAALLARLDPAERERVLDAVEVYGDARADELAAELAAELVPA